MSQNNLISVFCFGQETGRLGFDEDRNVSYFQYNPAFLKSGRYMQLFPGIIKRVLPTQVFRSYTGATFRGLPPAIADSLPDNFGNTIFKAWLTGKGLSRLSIPELLAYVGLRGMGALEYHPAKEIKGPATISIDDITDVVTAVLKQKGETSGKTLDTEALLNIFRIGTSAGGVRPKILVAEHKDTGQIIPGDLVYTADYNHYLVKLGIDEQLTYRREVMEYAYYKTALAAGINMMPAKLIDGRHFATLRFDRTNREKVHVLTASGISGLDFRDPSVSSWENLFDIALHLKVPHRDVEELFRRMVFNLVYANHDDHLKNHSFIYNKEEDTWQLAPAYDLTYSLNPELNFQRISRALSVCGKRSNITPEDIIATGERYTVKDMRGIIREVCRAVNVWETTVNDLHIPADVAAGIQRDFNMLM